MNATVVLPGDSVKATVREHEITLSGKVAWNFQREAAEYAVAGLAGVTAALSTVGLKLVLPFSADEARSRIGAALIRNAQTAAKNIHIASAGSEIDLTGKVSSWAEFRQAGYAAWSTPGVTNVKNRLTVVA